MASSRRRKRVWQVTTGLTNIYERGGVSADVAIVYEIAPNRDYHHRLMDYNNDPRTTFADVQKVLQLLQDRIIKRLSETSSPRSQK